MAILFIAKAFMGNEEDAEFIFSVFDWLKREHNANYKQVESPADQLNGNLKFIVEGDGIPEGDKVIDIVCERITQDAYTLRIE